MKNKKTQSEVITTVLIILIVLAAVFIVYVAVRNMVKSGTEKASTAPLDVSLTASKQQWGNFVTISVTRGAGSGELVAIRIVFKNATALWTYENRTSLPGELETVVYSIDLTENIRNIISYEVYPVLKVGAKEIIGLPAVKSFRGCSGEDECADVICTTKSCRNGNCEYANKSARTSCGSGLICDGNGNCGNCIDAGDCGVAPACQQYSCADTDCVLSNLAAGASCGSGKFCDGNGNCGDCFGSGAGNCAVKQCNSVSCTIGDCIYTQLPSGSVCFVGSSGTCDSSGSCIVPIFNGEVYSYYNTRAFFDTFETTASIKNPLYWPTNAWVKFHGTTCVRIQNYCVQVTGSCCSSGQCWNTNRPCAIIPVIPVYVFKEGGCVFGLPCGQICEGDRYFVFSNQAACENYIIPI